MLQFNSLSGWWGILVAGLMVCYSCWYCMVTSTIWWLRRISWCRMLPTAAATLAVLLFILGCEGHEDEWGGSAGMWLTAGKVRPNHEPQLISFSSLPCLSTGLSHGESTDVLYCIAPCVTLQHPAHCQDPSWGGVPWALKLNYDSPHSCKAFESFLCLGHLVFTSQLLQPISFHKNFK